MTSNPQPEVNREEFLDIADAVVESQAQLADLLKRVSLIENALRQWIGVP